MTNMEQKNLRFYLDVVSFAALDAAMFLDSHPCDPEALEYFNHYNQARQQALKEYAMRFGPLTLSTVQNSHDHWKWVTQPWPWEGEDC